MKEKPLVSVICLCFNQASYVQEAIYSVLDQNYPNIELIIADDASTDHSKYTIRSIVSKLPKVKFLSLNENVGNCRAFNLALQYVHGEYVIDLAADDMLMPDRVSLGVEALEEKGEAYGVNFANVEIVDREGHHLRHHYPVDSQGRAKTSPPEGDLYTTLVSRYVVNPVSMLIRKAVFDKIGGYDDSLSYEDFDFWVRSSRDFKYCYTDEVLVRKRLHGENYSSEQYTTGSTQLQDTYRICEKIATMNKSRQEKKALNKRIMYEMKQCMRLRELGLANKYRKLLMARV